MPGANYTGGKRNAVKAKARDVTGRLQKGYFNRRRLEILSKGLAGGIKRDELTKTTGRAEEKGPATITFAHAKRQGAPRSMCTAPPDPTHSVKRMQELDICRPKLRSHYGAHTSSPDDIPGVSVEEQNDQPSDIRRKILEMPDLAALSTSITLGRPRIREDESFKVVNSDSVRHESPEQKFEQLSLAPEDMGQSAMHRGTQKPDSNAASQESWNDEGKLSTPDWDTSSYTALWSDGEGGIEGEDPVWEDRIEDAASASNSCSSSVDEDVAVEELTDEISEWSSSGWGSSSSEEEDVDISLPSVASTCPPAPPGEYEDTGVPMWVDFRQAGRGCIYGGLFEHRSPWNVVGRILGFGFQEDEEESEHAHDVPSESDSVGHPEPDGLTAVISQGVPEARVSDGVVVQGEDVDSQTGDCVAGPLVEIHCLADGASQPDVSTPASDRGGAAEFDSVVLLEDAGLNGLFRLPERDGRFAGPCLFFGEESDDE